MEMEQNSLKQEKRSPRSRRGPAVVMALVFIVLGVMMLLHRQGVIAPELYRILLPGLLVVIGIGSLVRRRRLAPGVLLIGVGLFYLIPRLLPAGSGWSTDWSTFWPLLSILLGIMVLLQLLRPSGCCRHTECVGKPVAGDGFVEVDSSFSAMHHIVLDPVFRGARIRTGFSGTVLDLKHTTLAEGDTFVDIQIIFSGLELHVPDSWTVVTYPLAPALAAVEDKRFLTAAPDTSRRLVLRGGMILSGIEIKS